MEHLNHNTNDHIDNNLIKSTIDSALKMVDNSNSGIHSSHNLKDGMVVIISIILFGNLASCLHII